MTICEDGNKFTLFGISPVNIFFRYWAIQPHYAKFSWQLNFVILGERYCATLNLCEFGEYFQYFGFY